MVINHVSKSWDDPPSGKVQDKLLRAGGFAVEGAKRAAPLLSLPWALGVRAVVPWLKSWVTFASGKGIETKAGLSAFIDLKFWRICVVALSYDSFPKVRRPASTGSFFKIVQANDPL